MSRAAKRCIIVTEKILPSGHFIAQPEMTVVPEIFVEAVVHAPNGAWPTAVFPNYGIDEEAMRRYLDLSVSASGLERYLEETLEQDCMEVPA
jgi:glutaconate CoA-transferase subunit A